jgi:Holliday junction resolvasome RuvABC endonuclease subunit
MNQIFNIFSIDPGINHLGLSITSIDFNTKEVLSTDTKTIHAKEKYLNKHTIENYGLKQAKIDYLNQIFIDLLNEYRPITVAIETPFYNLKRPAAFMPLVELLYQLSISLRATLASSNLALYQPSIIKKTIGASAICKKEEVREYVLKKKDFFKYKSIFPMEDLDEHSIDSLAIFYTHYSITLKDK